MSLELQSPDAEGIFTLLRAFIRANGDTAVTLISTTLKTMHRSQVKTF